LTQVPVRTLTRVLAHVSAQRWGKAEALALQTLARESAASTRAVAADSRASVVITTLAKHLLDLHERSAEVEVAISDLLKDDPDSQRLQEIPGSGPTNAAVIRAELGDVQRFSGGDQVDRVCGLGPAHDVEWRLPGPTPLVQTRSRCVAPCRVFGDSGRGTFPRRLARSL
jgi:transposase